MHKYSIINILNEKVLNYITTGNEKNLQYLSGNNVFMYLFIFCKQKFGDGCYDGQGVFMSGFGQNLEWAF